MGKNHGSELLSIIFFSLTIVQKWALAEGLDLDTVNLWTLFGLFLFLF